jgi:hypothetical protein
MSVSDISTARYPIKAESPQKGQNTNIKERKKYAKATKTKE